MPVLKRQHEHGRRARPRLCATKSWLHRLGIRRLLQAYKRHATTYSIILWLAGVVEQVSFGAEQNNNNNSNKLHRINLEIKKVGKLGKSQIISLAPNITYYTVYKQYSREWKKQISSHEVRTLKFWYQYCFFRALASRLNCAAETSKSSVNTAKIDSNSIAYSIAATDRLSINSNRSTKLLIITTGWHNYRTGNNNKLCTGHSRRRVFQ